MTFEQKQAPDCWTCRHFAITHQAVTPYACKLMGFRSRNLPAIQVLQVDHNPCRGYSLKQQPVSQTAHVA